MRFRISNFLICAMTVGLLAGLGGSKDAAAQTVRKLTYVTFLADTFPMTKTDIWFMDEVTRRTNGRITFEKYFSGSLLKPSDILPGVSSGAADIGNSVPSASPRCSIPNRVAPFGRRSRRTDRAIAARSSRGTAC